MLIWFANEQILEACAHSTWAQLVRGLRPDGGFSCMSVSFLTNVCYATHADQYRNAGGERSCSLNRGRITIQLSTDAKLFLLQYLTVSQP